MGLSKRRNDRASELSGRRLAPPWYQKTGRTERHRLAKAPANRMLLWCQGRVDQSSVEAAGDVAFERAHGFSVGLALADSALQVGA